MFRFEVRSFGLVIVAVVGLGFAGGPALAQEQGWPLQGRGGTVFWLHPWSSGIGQRAVAKLAWIYSSQ